VAIANSFSLQKEHQTAIKCLKRAIQLHPNSAYAHNLIGYEYISEEDMEKGLDSFRTAVRIDPRHANGKYERTSYFPFLVFIRFGIKK